MWRWWWRACWLMSIVQGPDLGALWGVSHRLDFTHHMTLIPQGPPVKPLVKGSCQWHWIFYSALSSRHYLRPVYAATPAVCEFKALVLQQLSGSCLLWNRITFPALRHPHQYEVRTATALNVSGEISPSCSSQVITFRSCRDKRDDLNWDVPL